MLVEFECPKCKGHIYDRWSLNGSDVGIKAMYLHWVLNPGLVFNELVLGQRLPKIMYVCKSCDTGVGLRSYVHCSGCDTFHPGLIWSKENALGNWLGYVCPKCGSEIPCLWNFTSLLVLALSSPIWYLPIKYNRKKLLARRQQQMIRFLQKSGDLPVPGKKQELISYKKMGLYWGTAMFLVFSLLQPAIQLISHGRFSIQAYFQQVLVCAAIGIFIWPVGGLIFGWAMQFLLEKRGKKALHLSIDKDKKESPEDRL